MKNFIIFILALSLVIAGGAFFVTRTLDAPGGQPRFLEHVVGGKLFGLSGTIVEERRVVGDFSRVELNGIGSVRLVLGSETAVAVKADSNVLAAVETEVRGGVLYLGIKPGRHILSGQVTYAVSAKSLEAIKTTGSGDVIVESTIAADRLELVSEGSGKLRSPVKVKQLEVRIAGSGDIDLSGSAESFTLSIHGSGDVKAFDLSGKAAEAKVAGSGSVELGSFESLNANIAGSGDIAYEGSPRISSQVFGSGKLRSK